MRPDNRERPGRGRRDARARERWPGSYGCARRGQRACGPRRRAAAATARPQVPRRTSAAPRVRASPAAGGLSQSRAPSSAVGSRDGASPLRGSARARVRRGAEVVRAAAASRRSSPMPPKPCGRSPKTARSPSTRTPSARATAWSRSSSTTLTPELPRSPLVASSPTNASRTPTAFARRCTATLTETRSASAARRSTQRGPHRGRRLARRAPARAALRHRLMGTAEHGYGPSPRRPRSSSSARASATMICCRDRRSSS